MPEQLSRWPSDPVLDAAWQALSPQRFCHAVAVHQAARRQPAAGSMCRVIEALYDPGEQVRLAYGLSDSPLPSDRLWPEGQIFYARYPVRQPMSRRGTVLNIDGVAVEVYRFPNDRRLRGLRRFAGRDQAAEVWQGWLRREQPGLRLDPATLRRALLRYVPEQKWIIQLSAQCHDAGGEQAKHAVAVRCSDIAGCRTFAARASALKQATAGLDGAFRIPRIMALDERLGLVATRWAWGSSVLELMSTGDARIVLNQVVCGLRAFHGASVGNLPQRRPEDYLQATQHCARDLQLAMPELSKVLGELMAEHARRCPEDGANIRATVHNDFHVGQLRGKLKGLNVLDFERCVMADPMVDVATFVTQLAMLPFRTETGVSRDQAQSWIKEFLTAWEHHSSAPVDLRVMRWYGVWALLTLARGMLRHLRGNWPTLVERCVGYARTSLSSRQAELVP